MDTPHPAPQDSGNGKLGPLRRDAGFGGLTIYLDRTDGRAYIEDRRTQ